jgi:hypothetical protein
VTWLPQLLCAPSPPRCTPCRCIAAAQAVTRGPPPPGERETGCSSPPLPHTLADLFHEAIATSEPPSIAVERIVQARSAAAPRLQPPGWWPQRADHQHPLHQSRAATSRPPPQHPPRGPEAFRTAPHPFPHPGTAPAPQWEPRRLTAVARQELHRPLRRPRCCPCSSSGTRAQHHHQHSSRHRRQ